VNDRLVSLLDRGNHTYLWLTAALEIWQNQQSTWRNGQRPLLPTNRMAMPGLTKTGAREPRNQPWWEPRSDPRGKHDRDTWPSQYAWPQLLRYSQELPPADLHFSTCVRLVLHRDEDQPWLEHEQSAPCPSMGRIFPIDQRCIAQIPEICLRALVSGSVTSPLLHRSASVFRPKSHHPSYVWYRLLQR